MSRNNDVFNVVFLPEKAANVVLTDRVSDLIDGEWAVFDYDTGFAVNVATAVPNNFFIAYRGDGTLGVSGKIYISAGTHIQKRRLEYYSTSNDAVAVPQIITVSGMTAESGATATNYDYGIKFDFRGNTEVYQRFGANQASKFAIANTKCVGSGTASDDADAEVIAQWAESIANDVDQFINISVAGTGITNTPVEFTSSGVSGKVGVWNDSVGVITEAAALSQIRAYATTSTDLSTAFTINTFSSIYYFCNVNAKYFKQRQIVAIPAFTGGTCTWGTITATQDMVYEKGRGYDVQELEYLGGGFSANPGVYRQSRLNGLPFSDFNYVAVRDTFYSVIALSYDQFSVAGWQEHLNHQSTYFVLNKVMAATPNFPKPTLDAIAAAAGITEVIV